MTIDWTHFTPGSALAGGLLVGLSAAWLILVDGRILGAAGVLGGLTHPRRGDWGWRVALLAGLIAAPLLAQPLLHVAAPIVEADTTTLILGGLMVGFGTRLGAGCTSGHGVCGLARLSLRSFAATATFMASGFLTVFVVRHILA